MKMYRKANYVKNKNSIICFFLFYLEGIFMSYKKYEQKGIIGGIIVNILVGIAGIFVYQITRIDAIFLDAYFTILGVISGIVAIIISKQSKRTSKAFPHGKFILEPLYAIFKSILTIFLLVYTATNVTIKAISYFYYGIGEKMNFGPIIPYEMITILLGIFLIWFYHKQNEKTKQTSTILLAETKNTIIDTLMSAGIGVGSILLLLIKEGTPFEFLLYTGDFFITILIVFLAIKEPIVVLKNGFIELANGVVTNEDTKQKIEKIVQENLPEDMEIKNCHIHKTGMSFRILVHIDTQTDHININELSEKSQKIKEELSNHYEHVRVNFLFP